LVLAEQEFLQFDEHVKMYNQFSEIRKDLHHISWKNHNTDSYIEQALKEYLKNEVESK